MPPLRHEDLACLMRQVRFPNTAIISEMRPNDPRAPAHALKYSLRSDVNSSATRNSFQRLILRPARSPKLSCRSSARSTSAPVLLNMRSVAKKAVQKLTTNTIKQTPTARSRRGGWSSISSLIRRLLNPAALVSLTPNVTHSHKDCNMTDTFTVIAPSVAAELRRTPQSKLCSTT